MIVFKALALLGLFLNITGAIFCGLAFGLTGDFRIAAMACVNLAFVVYLIKWYPWHVGSTHR